MAGSEQTLFYDTYALYAIAMGQKSYARFAEGHRILTSLMNLYELYYTLLRERQEQIAEAYVQQLLPSCVDITAPVIRVAARFRHANSKRKFSYIDCLGYTLARAHRIHFLTGDPAFREVPGVLFVP